MRPCDPMEERPFTSTHLISQCYTERRPTYNLKYILDYNLVTTYKLTFSRNASAKLSYSSAHTSGTKSEVEISNFFKTSVGCSRIGMVGH